MLFLLLCTSCNTHISETEKIITKWYQKEIVFPDNMIFVIKGDTVKYDFAGANYKILTFADSSDCIGCRLKLNQWDTYLSTINSDTKFIMVINNIDVNKIISQTKYDRFNRPIFIDNKGIFLKNNEMPQDIQYQTFLLDSQNRVIVLGNPLFNRRVDSLYRSIINTNCKF